MSMNNSTTLRHKRTRPNSSVERQPKRFAELRAMRQGLLPRHTLQTRIVKPDRREGEERHERDGSTNHRKIALLNLWLRVFRECWRDTWSRLRHCARHS